MVYTYMNAEIAFNWNLVRRERSIHVLPSFEDMLFFLCVCSSVQ